MLQDVKSCLGRCFAMKDLGEAACILGIKIYRDRSRRLIGLCQSAYFKKILKRYHMENSKRESIPMQEKLRLSKSQGASTPTELKRMQNVPYASAVGSIILGTSLDLLLLLWKARIPFEGKGRQGGDGGACKLLGCLLGDVIEVLEVLGCFKNGS
ncbi:retrotransposon protein, putative, ty1-copia subclass [Tanacetum coccineum]